MDKNKTLLKSILVVIVAITAFYALIPIEKASTVHTSISNEILNTTISEVGNQVSTVCSSNLSSDSLIISSTADFIVFYQLSTIPGAIASPTIEDGTNTFTFDMAADETATGTLAYPGGSTVTISDPDATSPAEGCATVITETGGTGTVT